MARVIKANMVTIAEDFQKINVPMESFFKPEPVSDDEGFKLSEFATAEIGENEPVQQEAVIDPEIILQKAREEAEEIINQANHEADTIIQYAKLNAEKEKEQIYAEAKAEGYDAGVAQADEIIAKANKTYKKAEEDKAELLKSAEPEIVSFVISLVEKLLGNIVRINPEVILYIIKTGLEGAGSASELSVRVSKDDYDAALEVKEVIESFVDSDTVLSIIKDAELTKGSCVIDTPIGSIDSSLDSQWNLLKNDLVHILSN